MAKKFAGFKPETMQNKILPALGYNGPMDQKSINAFLAANPAAAAKMGKYTLAAKRVVEEKPSGYQEGGLGESTGDKATKKITSDPTSVATLAAVEGNTPVSYTHLTLPTICSV